MFKVDFRDPEDAIIKYNINCYKILKDNSSPSGYVAILYDWIKGKWTITDLNNIIPASKF